MYALTIIIIFLIDYSNAVYKLRNNEIYIKISLYIRRIIMESIQLELYSVNHLELALAATSYLYPVVSKLDKEPSWDGFVYLHSDQTYKKENIGKVPVQVKASYQEDISQNEITYPAQVIDLRNYLADGGVIYFVIYVKTYTEYTIFYAQLDTIKLKEILGEKTKGHKSIKLKKLPKESFDIVNIFKYFLYNRKQQMSFADGTVYTLDTITEKYEQVQLGFYMSGLGLNKDNFQTFIDYNNVYLYADSPNFPIPIPLMGQLTKIIAIEEDNQDISINNEVFYTKQTRERAGKITTFLFGDSFEIVINKNKFTFNYKAKHNVRILLKDLRFLILMFENNGFDINNHFFDMTDVLKQDKSFDIEKNKTVLKEYKEIVELLDYLNIDGDLDLIKLSKKEFRDIAILRKALLDKEEVLLKENISIATCMEIQNYSIALAFYLKENETNIYKIEDIFQVEDSVLYSKNLETNVKIAVPIFRIMNAQDLAKSSNIHFESLIEKYKILDKEPNILSDANLFVLQLILAADLCTENDLKRNNFLQTSLTFMDWLKKENKNPDKYSIITSSLNELQVFKRLRLLSHSEIEELIEIADSSESPNDIKFGASVLLDDKRRAINHLNKLSYEDQEFMKDFPIYNLFRTL